MSLEPAMVSREQAQAKLDRNRADAERDRYAQPALDLGLPFK